MKSIPELILFFLLTLLIEILGTVGGFGSSVFFVPLANKFFNFHQVLGILSLLHVFSNLSKIFFFKKGLDKTLLLQIGLPSFIFVILGAYYSKFINTKSADLYVGIFLVLFSLFLIIFPKFIIKASRKNAIIGGSFSGWMAGWLGTGGAIRGLTLSAFNVQKDAFLATSAFIDLIVDFSRFGMYTYQGYLTKETFKMAPFLLIISFVGSYFGKNILKKISQNKFRKISLWLIFITGFLSLTQLIFRDKP